MEHKSVREVVDARHTQTRANRADFRKKLAAVPKDVRYTYHLWRKKIQRAALKRARTRKRVSVVLSKFFGSEMTPQYIRQLVDLLTHPAQGWEVRVKTEGFWTYVTVTIR